MDCIVLALTAGPPGCSKTLSFKIASETMRGEKSQCKFFRSFVAIHGDVFHYQCSEHSTSNEIKTVFDRAVERQQLHSRQRNSGRRSVVFLDEAGLPEDAKESLKLYWLKKRSRSCKIKLRHPLEYYHLEELWMARQRSTLPWIILMWRSWSLSIPSRSIR